MVRVAAPGACSRPSTMTLSPLSASCSSQKPPPPSPELYGSTTASAADTATAASNALPPAAKICMPAAVAAGWALAMAACGGVLAAAANDAVALYSSRIQVNRRAAGFMICPYCVDSAGVLAQPFGHGCGYQATNIATHESNFAYQRGRNMGVFGGGGQQYRIHIRRQVAVHGRHLALVFIIADTTHTPYQHIDAVLTGKIHDQSGHRHDLGVGRIRHHLARQLQAFLLREQRLLAGIGG